MFVTNMRLPPLLLLLLMLLCILFDWAFVVRDFASALRYCRLFCSFALSHLPTKDNDLRVLGYSNPVQSFT